MAKRQVVSLNTSTPQLASPQTGDTYQLVRDVFLTTGIMKSEVADGASAVGFVFDTENSFANASAKIASFKNAGTEKLSITKAGAINQVDNVLLTSHGRNVFRCNNSDTNWGYYYLEGGDIGQNIEAGNLSVKSTSGTFSISCNAGPPMCNITRSSWAYSAYQLRGAGATTATLTIAPEGWDDVTTDLTIIPEAAKASATVNLIGGKLYLLGGKGASASAGNAHGGNVYLRGGTGYGTGHNGYIIMDNLPTSSPGVTGALWNDSGTLKIS